jgi:alkylated DNA nucleotide flippase Atl1
VQPDDRVVRPQAPAAGAASAVGDAGDVVEAILATVERIPVGRVLSYGDVAELAGVGTARQVGRIMSREGGSVPWHRVLRADGSCAQPVRSRQLALLRAEGVPFRRGGERVDMAAARWDGETVAPV